MGRKSVVEPEATQEPVVESTPEPVVESTPEPVVEPEATPEPVVEPEATQESVVESTPEPELPKCECKGTCVCPRVIAKGALITRRGVRASGETVRIEEISGGVKSWEHLVEAGFIK